MNSENKRSPAFQDTDAMTFGKHRGELLQDVPPRYLVWLWQDGGLNMFSKNLPTDQIHLYKQQVVDKVKLANYIWNSKEAIEQEIGDTFI